MPPPPPPRDAGAIARKVVAAQAKIGRISFDDVLRAAKDNQPEMMEALLMHGVEPSASNKIGQTGLHVAAIWGCYEVALVLLEGGANVNAANSYGITPLHHASQSSHHALARLLIEWGADTQRQASNGRKPFEAAKK